jgi:hypothetical protein
LQHASDKWSIAIFVAILSIIIVYKIIISVYGRQQLARQAIAATAGIAWFVVVFLIFRLHNGWDLSVKWTVSLVLTALTAYFGALMLKGEWTGVPTIRRIPGLNAIDEAIGRSTEMGRPVLMVPGISGFDIVTLQALSIFSYIAKAVAQFGNRCILTTIDPAVQGVAEETLRDAYESAGRPELFDVDDVRFLSGQQFAFASGVAGIIYRERVATSFMLGNFYAESLILAENGQMAGAIQIAGGPQTTQLPFFIASCDYVLLGDEFYAASAYISRNATLLGSIVGQDYCKLLMISAALIGAICATFLQWHSIAHSHIGHAFSYFVSIFNQ